MANCKQCNKEYEGKGRSLYCSTACKQEFYRNRMKEVCYDKPVPVTIRNAKPVTIADLEKCQYCGQALPKLSRPRRYPGACYLCAIAQPSKPIDNTLSSQPALHTTHKMTVMERLFYRPIVELLPGQTNFVSLPGRACYGVY